MYIDESIIKRNPQDNSYLIPEDFQTKYFLPPAGPFFQNKIK